LTDPGFDASVLSEFRSRLIAGTAEMALFEPLRARLREHGLVTPRGRQRTDATHVLAAVQVLNRLECGGEALRHALNTLATVAPDWLRSWVPADWFDRDARRIEDDRLPDSNAERSALADQIGADGRLLLEGVYACDTPPWLRAVPAVQVLRRVWLPQVHAAAPEEAVCWRTADDLPPAPLLIRSPDDPAARDSKKRDTEWVGYKAHLTETCAEETLHLLVNEETPPLLVNGETTPATVADRTMTGALHRPLVGRDLVPRAHIVDTSYVTSAHRVTAERLGADLLGPVLPDQSWQARAAAGVGAASVVSDGDAQRATGPRGKTRAVWRPTTDSGGHAVSTIRVAHADCSVCPVRPPCVHAPRPRAAGARDPSARPVRRLAGGASATDDAGLQGALRATRYGRESKARAPKGSAGATSGGRATAAAPKHASSIC